MQARYLHGQLYFSISYLLCTLTNQIIHAQHFYSCALFPLRRCIWLVSISMPLKAVDVNVSPSQCAGTVGIAQQERVFFCCLNIVQLEPRHADRVTPHISRPPLFHAPGILFYTHLAVIKHEALGIFRISVTFGRVWSAFLWVWMELRGRSSHQTFM